MDIERLEVIGHEVAQQVAASTGIDDISFVVLPGTDNGSFEVSGVVVKAGREGAYTMNTEQVHKLLDAPEARVRSFLQEYFEYVVRSVLSSDDQMQDSAYGTYDEQDSDA